MNFGNILRYILGGPQAATSLARPAVDAVVNTLPKTYSGTPIRDVLVGKAYASGPTTAVQGASTSPNYLPAPTGPGGAYPIAGGVPSGGGSPAPIPQNSGQQTGGGSGGSSGGFGDYLSSLFDQSKNALQGLIPTYDADFANYQNQVNKSIDQAQSARDAQLADNSLRYGQAQKQLVQNANDLKGRTQSTFSGLGSLDSSAYGDELLKQQQNEGDNLASLTTQRTKDESAIGNTFNTYKNNQLAQVDAYQQEINRAKQGVQQAIANNDISRAQDLANYATNLQNSINGFATNLASAQAAGTDVIGNLRKINGSDFLNQFGQLLAGQYNNGIAKYVIPSSSASGQGYIGSSASLTDQQKKLLGLI